PRASCHSASGQVDLNALWDMESGGRSRRRHGGIVIGFQRSCATLCVGVLLMSVSGCTSSSDDELARSRDLASYGCALVSHLENGAAVESWELLPGLDADSPTTSATAVVGLLGGMS